MKGLGEKVLRGTQAFNKDKKKNQQQTKILAAVRAQLRNKLGRGPNNVLSLGSYGEKEKCGTGNQKVIHLN